MIPLAALGATLSLPLAMMGVDPTQPLSGTRAATAGAVSDRKTARPDSLSPRRVSLALGTGAPRPDDERRALAVSYTIGHPGKFDSRREWRAGIVHLF